MTAAVLQDDGAGYGYALIALFWFFAGAPFAVAVMMAIFLGRQKRMDARLEKLERLDELVAQVEKLGKTSHELDLRRVEHVLLDVRDAQKRTEERLLALAEARTRSEREPGALAEPTAGALSERVVGRLLALGYERVHIVTPHDELARIASTSGEVVVEARRDGAACKGRVLVRSGSIQDVQLQSAYGMFP